MFLHIFIEKKNPVNNLFILQLATMSFAYVIDNINKNMIRRHHTIELTNKMFNGTMRAATLMPPNTEAEITKMRAAQEGGVSRLTILPGQADCGAIRAAFETQGTEIFAYLRGKAFTKRESNPSKLHWCPLEIVQKDSNYTDEMINILDELQKECSIRKPTP